MEPLISHSTVLMVGLILLIILTLLPQVAVLIKFHGASRKVTSQFLRTSINSRSVIAADIAQSCIFKILQEVNCWFRLWSLTCLSGNVESASKGNGVKGGGRVTKLTVPCPSFSPSLPALLPFRDCSMKNFEFLHCNRRVQFRVFWTDSNAD